MKMNLSVVMGLIDKVSAPLKAITSESNHHTRKIKEMQQAQSDTGAALHMIDSHRLINKEMEKNTLSLNEAKDKLAELQAKEDASAKKKQALNDAITEQTEQLAKRTEQLAKLKAGTENSTAASSKLNAKIIAQSKALEVLKANAAAANKPNHALTMAIFRQTERVEKLTQASDDHALRLKQNSKGMKKAGIDASQLDSEYARLTERFDKHGKVVDKVSKRYDTLKKYGAPLKKMNNAIKLPSMEAVKGGAAIGVGALASVAAYGAIINDTANQVKQLSLAAKDVDMPVEQLQALRLQAQMAGAEVDDMDAAIKEMSLRWGEMKSLGTGAMNDYFKDTGNRQAYNDLKNAKDVMAAYEVIVREIAKETDVAKQNFMADEFFGGDSEKMLSVLKGGVDGLNKAKQELRDTGGPIDESSITAASDFSAGLKKLLRIMDSLKVSALTPVMKELSVVFSDIAEKMKNMKWRNEAIVQLRETVSSVFTVFKSLGGGILFLSENFKEIIATIALVKLGFVALNVAMYANPIGLIVTGIAAAVVAVTYLIDKFVGLGYIMDSVKNLFNWGSDADEPISKINEISSKMDELNGKRAKLDITTNEAINTKNTHLFERAGTDPTLSQLNDLRAMAQQLEIRKPNVQDTAANHKSSNEPGLAKLSPIKPIVPLMNYAVQSQAEVALTIKSDKPVVVDKVKSDKGTSLNVDVGSMAMSY